MGEDGDGGVWLRWEGDDGRVMVGGDGRKLNG